MLFFASEVNYYRKGSGNFEDTVRRLLAVCLDICDDDFGRIAAETGGEVGFRARI